MQHLTISENPQLITNNFNPIDASRKAKGSSKSSFVPNNLSLPTRKLKAQTTLYQAGNHATSLYIINQGVFKAIIPTAMGTNRIADLYGSGDLLGSAAMHDTTHIETVVAIEECIVTPIDPRQYMYDSSFSKYLVTTLAKQMRRHREFIADTELPVGARLTRTLTRLANRFGKTQSNGLIHLPTKLTHNEFAELTGCSRVTITRIFCKLRRAKVVTGNSRGNYILNIDLLEDAIEHFVMEVL